MPTSAPKRLSDKVKPWISEALKEDHAVFSEEVTWDTSIAVFPDHAAASVPNDASTDPSAVVPLPTFVIYLEIPGLRPEAPLYISPIIPPFGLTKADVKLAVSESLKKMRAFRTELQASQEKSETDEKVTLDNLTAD